jgi:hypothetical protein
LTIEHPLLQTLASWTGRRPTQKAFEAIGFSIHNAWQDEIIQSCGKQRSDLINRYWDEVAIETMQSLGQGHSDARKFVIEPKYRSAFLDELSAIMDFADSRFRSPSLVKCLFEYHRKVFEDQDFRQRRVTFFADLRKAEVERLGIDAAISLKTKQAVIPYLEQFCGALGFESRSRNRWRKKAGSRLVFEIGVWLAGNAFRMQSPLKFRIFHADEPKYAFDAEGPAVLGRLVPGADEYGRFGNDREYILGVKAQIELFNVIAGTFDDV